MLQRVEGAPRHSILKEVDVNGLGNTDHRIDMIFACLVVLKYRCCPMNDVPEPSTMGSGTLIPGVGRVFKDKSSLDIDWRNEQFLEFSFRIETRVLDFLVTFLNERRKSTPHGANRVQEPGGWLSIGRLQGLTEVTHRQKSFRATLSHLPAVSNSASMRSSAGPAILSMTSRTKSISSGDGTETIS